MRERNEQKKREAGKEGFRKAGIKERRDTGKRDTGKEGCKRGGIWKCASLTFCHFFPK